MKKIFLFPAILLAFAAASFCAGPNTKKNTASQPDKDDPPMIMIGNYDDEEEPAKPEKPKSEVKKDAAKNQEKAVMEEVKKAMSGQENRKNPAEPKKTGTVEHEFEAFRIKLPAECDIQLSDDKKASTIGESGASCPVKGHLGQFDKKIETKYLVEMYQKRCENNKRKQLYKRWLNNKNIEGYLTVCQGEDKTEVAMEANSVTKDLNYQFLGSVKGEFTQAKKVAIYMMLNSITGKPAEDAALPAQ